MAPTDTAFAFVAVYADAARADEDFAAVEDAAGERGVHVHDVAIVRHAEGGKVEIVRRDARSAAHGAEAGVIVGALVGILFPPALPALLIGAAAGGGLGGLLAHLWRGLARDDLKALGEAVEEGETAIVAIGTAEGLDRIEAALAHASRTVRREIDADLGDLGDSDTPPG
jgi:uncharacterized membrane protein